MRITCSTYLHSISPNLYKAQGFNGFCNFKKLLKSLKSYIFDVAMINDFSRRELLLSSSSLQGVSRGISDLNLRAWKMNSKDVARLEDFL